VGLQISFLFEAPLDRLEDIVAVIGYFREGVKTADSCHWLWISGFEGGRFYSSSLAKGKKMVLSGTSDSVNRNIYFYRIDNGITPDGRSNPFDVKPFLELLNKLPFTENSGRYLADKDQSILCMWIDQIPDNSHIRFGRVRRSALPLIEDHGDLKELTISDDAGLLETTHIVFFPNNIVGAEFNFYGPRATWLGYYFHRIIGNICPLFKVMMLLKSSMYRELEKLHDLSLLDLTIRPSYVDQIRKLDSSLGDAFDATTKLGDSDKVQLVLKYSGDNRKIAWTKFKQFFKALAQKPDFALNVDSCLLKGTSLATDRIDTFDLLKAQLLQKKSIVRQGFRSRALNANSAYSVIEEAYAELASEITEAAAIS